MQIKQKIEKARQLESIYRIIIGINPIIVSIIILFRYLKKVSYYAAVSTS